MAPRGQVLLIEDDEEIRESLLEILVEHGYEARGAVHGRDALEQLRASPFRPCLILLDLMMPVMDGRSFREEQLRSPELAQIPVVVISAFGELAHDVDQLQSVAYLSKPLDLAELLQVLAKHCDPSDAP